MPVTSDARATEPSHIGEAEKSRSIFNEQRFLGNFSLPFPDKDLGHGSAAASDFQVCALAYTYKPILDNSNIG
jgi:hypothetical protein